MNAKLILTVILVLILVVGIGLFLTKEEKRSSENNKEDSNQEKTMDFKLPSPDHKGMTLEETLEERRSIRNYKDEALTKEELSQLLWAAQGITDQQRGFRTAPSAGALYPLKVYVDVKKVEGIQAGVYKYEPEGHRLILKNNQTQRDRIYQAALQQNHVKEAPVLLIITGVYERVTKKYGEPGVKYTHMEAGHAAQNVYLQVVSLGLGTVSVGAFDDSRIKEILEAKGKPLYLMPVGRPSS